MTSFVGEFNAYLKTRTDAPPDFHIHAAMATLAYALGNNVWCEGWGRPIYPNLWVTVIAKSGYGKSVPLDMAESLIHKAGLGEGLLPGSFSQEALLTRLSETPTSMFCLQEFSAFVKMLDREYNSGAIAWLTELYDVPETYKRILLGKGGKTITLKRPCITILGASSPDWFAESYKASMLRGGFLARFLFCPSNQAGKYVGYPGPRSDAIESGLSGWLGEVANLHGPFDTSGVRKMFNEWDHESRKRLREDCPPEFSGMRARAGLMVWKAAMLLHVSTNVDDLVLTEKDLANAIKYVERCHAMAEKYLSEEVATDRWEVHRLKLLEVIDRAGGTIQWSKAMQNSHLSSRDMREAVDTLRQSERLDVQPGPGKGYLCLPGVKPEPPHKNGVAF